MARPKFNPQAVEHERLLSGAEVAEMFKVSSHTVGCWARVGRLPFVWTPGRRRRYREAQVLALLNGTREGGQP